MSKPKPPERLLIRTRGGPHHGTEVSDVERTPWPLPDVLPGDDGVYRKVSESQLPPQPFGSVLVRGAEYQWRAGETS